MSEYDQKKLEKKWQKKWQDEKIYHFDFESNKKPYSIDVPPRYASGPFMQVMQYIIHILILQHVTNVCVDIKFFSHSVLM